MRNDSESLGPYSPNVDRMGGRTIDMAYLKDVFARIIHEAEDADTTAEMFEPYGKVINFIQANRKIREQVSAGPLEDEGPAEPEYGAMNNALRGQG
jgi:hypothetical protein